MQSKAATVAQYLAELPVERREIIQTVRRVILENLDSAYEEGMQYGMIGYYVPHRVFPAGYHCDPRQPLPFAGLASQKNHMALYVMLLQGTEMERWFHEAWARIGKKLDMGKCCIRFKKLEDLALDVVGEVFRRTPARTCIAHYARAMAEMGRGSAGSASYQGPRKAASRQPAHPPETARVQSGLRSRRRSAP